MARYLTPLLILGSLSGCYVYARPAPPPGHYQPAPAPAYQPAPEVQPSQGGMTQAPAAAPAPAPQAQPAALSFTFSPTSVRRGDDVTLQLSTAAEVTVWYNGRPLPKKVLNNGLTLVVTIPGDGASGYFELEWSGQRIRSPQQLSVLP